MFTGNAALVPTVNAIPSLSQVMMISCQEVTFVPSHHVALSSDSRRWSRTSTLFSGPGRIAHHASYRVSELPPLLERGPQGLQALGGEAIVAAAGTFVPGICLVTFPIAFCQAIPFEGMEERVDGAVLKVQGTVAALAEELEEQHAQRSLFSSRTEVILHEAIQKAFIPRCQ
jgi:hypothetical protein